MVERASWGNFEEKHGFGTSEGEEGLRWRYVEHVGGNAEREDDAEKRSARSVRIGGAGRASESEWTAHLAVECEGVAQIVR